VPAGLACVKKLSSSDAWHAAKQLFAEKAVEVHTVLLDAAINWCTCRAALPPSMTMQLPSHTATPRNALQLQKVPSVYSWLSSRVWRAAGCYLQLLPWRCKHCVGQHLPLCCSCPAHSSKAGDIPFSWQPESLGEEQHHCAHCCSIARVRAMSYPKKLPEASLMKAEYLFRPVTFQSSCNAATYQ